MSPLYYMCFGTVVLLLTSLYFQLNVIFFLIGNGGVRVRTRYVYCRTNVPHKVNVGFFSFLLTECKVGKAQRMLSCFVCVLATCKSVYSLGIALLEWVLRTCSDAVNQDWLKVFGTHLQFSWNSRHVKKNASVDSKLPLAFDTLWRNEDCFSNKKCITSWIVVLFCWTCYMLSSSWISLNVWLTVSLESGCFCGRFCLDMWSLDSADSWVTQWQKLKASRRFCVNGGMLCPMFLLNLYVHRRRPIKIAHISAATRRINEETRSIEALLWLLWWIHCSCLSQKEDFFSKCATICWMIIEETEDTNDALKPRTLLLTEHRWLILHNGERRKMNCRVAASYSRFVSRETPQRSTSSTFKFPKWSAMNHIISDKCVFCLPVVLTPLMTINAECALYSTFFF